MSHRPLSQITAYLGKHGEASLTQIIHSCGIERNIAQAALDQLEHMGKVTSFTTGLATGQGCSVGCCSSGSGGPVNSGNEENKGTPGSPDNSGGLPTKAAELRPASPHSPRLYRLSRRVSA
jgi:hypothetical protein